MSGRDARGAWPEIVAAAEAIRATAIAVDHTLEGLPLAGIGWATVDAERAQRELDDRLGSGEHGAPASWLPLRRDPSLGARAWLRSAVHSSHGLPSGAPALVLLEPDTEGRIAASLARFGEGVAVIYLGDGPAGAGRLLPGGGMWGPHVVLVGSGEGTA